MPSLPLKVKCRIIALDRVLDDQLGMRMTASQALQKFRLRHFRQLVLFARPHPTLANGDPGTWFAPGQSRISGGAIPWLSTKPAQSRMRSDAPRLVDSRRFLFLSRVLHAAAPSLDGIEERTAFARNFFVRGLHAAGGGRSRRSFGRDRDGGGLPSLDSPARRRAARNLS